MVSSAHWLILTYLHSYWSKCYLYVVLIQLIQPTHTLHMLSKVWTDACNAQVLFFTRLLHVLHAEFFAVSSMQRP